MTAFANINGETLVSATVHVPNVGPWWAEVVFELAPDIEGAATMNLGAVEFVGTFRPQDSGTFGAQRKGIFVAGAGGWSKPIAAKHYHNDGGVRARTVVEESTRLAGETLGGFNVTDAVIGVDYVRQAGPASRSLEDAIKGTVWHVGYNGRTEVGERVSELADVTAYTVLGFNPQSKTATLTVDDLSLVVVGSRISEGLDSEETITELRIEVTADNVRVYAYVGGSLSAKGRLAQLLRGIVERTTSKKLFGKYRYRYVRPSVDRVELQAVAAIAGLPDVLPVSMWPGVSGAHAKLAPGTIVLVEFIEGDRTMPIVVAFSGKDGTGHAPQELDFSVTTTMRLGSDAATQGVPLGDSLKSYIDGHVHSAGLYVAPPFGGSVIGTSGAPTEPSPAPSSKVKVE